MSRFALDLWSFGGGGGTRNTDCCAGGRLWLRLLPTVTPTCSKCSQALLSVYATAIHDGTAYAPALKNALANATTLVNNQCGQNWVTYVSSTSAGRKRWNVGWMELGLTGLLVGGSLVGVGWTL